MRRLYNRKSGQQFKLNNDGTASGALATGKYFEVGAWRLYSFTTAITANVTTTTAPAGSLAKTSHATGLASIFRSDGTKWQFLTNA
jgi:hypothetical protein